MNGNGPVTFFALNGVVLGLYPVAALAVDAGADLEAGGGLSRMALAHNVRDRKDVDRVLARVEEAGARLVRPAADAEWGGRSGYFADPDGFLSEVAWNPGFPILDDGSVEVPA